MRRTMDMPMSEGEAADLPASWGGLSLVLGLAVTATTLAMVAVTANPIPVFDQWDNLVAGHEVGWTWLTAQHNEHRLLFPRLVFVLDHVMSGETNVVDLALNVVLVAATAATMIRLAGRSRLLRPRSQARWTLGLVSGLLFSAIQSENFTWGFQVQFFGVCTLAVATLSVLILAPPGWRSLGLVMLLEAVGLYTLSSGIVIVVLTVAVTLWLGRPRSHVAALGVAAAVLLASYLAGYRTPPAHTAPAESLAHLAMALAYGLTELGLPIWSLTFLRDAGASAIFGAVGLILFCRFGARLWRRRGTGRLEETAWLAIAAFALGVAALTALGRSGFGIEQALASRYATPMILFWLPLLMLGLIEARQRGERSYRIVAGTGLALLGLVAAQQPRLVQRAIRYDALRRSATPAVLAGVADPTMLARIYPTLGGVMDRRPALKQDRASVFKDPWADWLGTPMPGAETSATLPACDGEVAALTAIDDASHPGWRVTGRFREPGLSGRLILVDGDKTVVGYGLAGFGAKAAGEPPGAGTGDDWWIGAFGPSDPAAVTAVALRPDDTPGCALGPFRPGR